MAGKVAIKTGDMNLTLEAQPEDMQKLVLRFTEDAFNLASRERDVAASIRQELEREIGRTWNVVVGKNFGADVTHESKRYLQLKYGELTVLVWKSS